MVSHSTSKNISSVLILWHTGCWTEWQFLDLNPNSFLFIIDRNILIFNRHSFKYQVQQAKRILKQNGIKFERKPIGEGTETHSFQLVISDEHLFLLKCKARENSDGSQICILTNQSKI